jgi:hypothetical protein
MSISELDMLVLESVLTVKDVMRGWHLTQTQVMMHVYKDRFIARQSRDHEAWLILRQSVVDTLGQPKVELGF